MLYFRCYIINSGLGTVSMSDQGVDILLNDLFLCLKLAFPDKILHHF